MKVFIKNLLVTLICICFLVSSLSVIGFAANTATVSADEVSVGESNLLVPVRISSDTNVMGFKISLSFSDAQVKVKNISRGSVTAKGSFNDNLGLEQGKVDVVWHNTSEVAADGTLFVLTLDTTRVTENAEIKVEFSQPDTFNEAYEDVKLNCSNIKITSGEAPAETEVITTENTDVDTTTSNKITSKPDESTTVQTSKEENYDGSQVIDSVNNALENSGNNTIYDVPAEEQDAFVDSVNNNMSIILGTDNIYFDSFADLLDSYTGHYAESFVNSAVDYIEPEVLNNILDETLKEFGASAIEDVADKKQFITTMETKLQQQNPDIEIISDYVKDDVVIEAIKELYSVNEQEILSNNEGNTSKKPSLFIPVVILIVFIALAVAVVATYKKKKAKKTK